MTQKARAARLQHSRNLRDKKRAALLNKKRMGADFSLPPLVLALIALSSSANTKKAKETLLEQVKKSESSFEHVMEVEDIIVEKDFMTTFLCRRHKLRLTVIEPSHGDLEGCLIAAKMADAIAFVIAATSETDDEFVDKGGKLCLSMLITQGLPTVFGLMQGLVDLPVKKRSDVRIASASALDRELPDDSKVFFADESEDYEKVLQFLSTHRLSSPEWRNHRPYVLVQELEFVPEHQAPEQGTLLVSGYVRGRGLSVNQLVHLTGLGDFQLKQVDILEDPCPLWRDHKGFKSEPMELENPANEKASFLYPDPMSQEHLIVENTPDSLAGEQTWPTEEELAKAEEEKHSRLRKRLLPKGTSEYQAALIVEESSDDEDNEVERGDEKMKGVDVTSRGDGVISEERHNKQDEYLLEEDASILDDDDDGQSDMMVEEESTAESRQAELVRLKAAHAADSEFPDEVDAPLDVPAKKRFVKYRGLESLCTSPWDPKESLPQEYGRIFSFDNFRRTQNHVFSKAQDVDERRVNGCVQVGAYVRLHVKDFSFKSALKVQSKYSQIPLVVCGLLQHESKMSVVHFSMVKHESFSGPLKSKESLIFHVGFRVFKTRPIYSTNDIDMDKHVMERFLHYGSHSIGSVFAPICFSPLPLLAFKETGADERLTLVASGFLKSVDPDRIVLKRIVLAGYPLRVQKQKAVVRFMFHNPEDVRWFKPVELWTKYGRCGRIKEPVGTHGAMKCVFDGVILPWDAVCVTLFKRVYPKWPQPDSWLTRDFRMVKTVWR